MRLWSETRPTRMINYSLDVVKVSGFYALNGRSVIKRLKDATAPSICKMLEAVRGANPGRPIVMVLDNASNHHSNLVKEKALELGIMLAFMPPYSPQYNPIEQIWKCVKREISKNFIIDKDELFWLIESVFMEKSAFRGYARSWMKKFLTKKMRNRILSSRIS